MHPLNMPCTRGASIELGTPQGVKQRPIAHTLLSSLRSMACGSVDLKVASRMLGLVAWWVAVRDGEMMEAGRNANATCTCRLHWCKLLQALYLLKLAHCGYVSAANQRLRGLEHVCRIPGTTLPKQLLFCVYSGNIGSMLAVFAFNCAYLLTTCVESAMQIMMEQSMSGVQQKFDVWL